MEENCKNHQEQDDLWMEEWPASIRTQGELLVFENIKCGKLCDNLKATCLYSVSHKTKIDKNVTKWPMVFGQPNITTTHIIQLYNLSHIYTIRAKCP